MKSQRTWLILPAVLFAAVCCTPAAAQTSAADAPQDEMQTRIRQLEAQVELMREELTKLKRAMPAQGEVEVVPASATTPLGSGEAASKSEESKPPAAKIETAKVEAAKQEPKPAATPERKPGIELGAVRAVPYGTLYFNLFGNSGGTNNADVPLFATPTGSGNTNASARQTRLGLRLEGPVVAGAKSSGALEADFFGGFPAIGIGEHFGVVRMRLAFARLDWERTSLVAGQDWMVFAPVNPSSIASAAIPQMATAGNPWARLPQVKLERRMLDGRLTWQGAVLSPGTGDFPSGTNTPLLLQPGAGSASRVPFFQSRVALSDKNWFGSKKTGAVGLSAQYGRARVSNTPGSERVDSFGLALDWNVPLHARFALSGEGFFGRNLAGFQAGVFQGANTDFAYVDGTRLVPAGQRAIGTRGGWAQAALTPPVMRDRLTLYASFGQDDPRDEDLVSVSRRDLRERNQALALSFLYRLSPQFAWGVEYRRFETDWALSGRQTANHLNLGTTFSF